MDISNENPLIKKTFKEEFQDIKKRVLLVIDDFESFEEARRKEIGDFIRGLIPNTIKYL